MKVLILPNAFKGSLTAPAAGKIIKKHAPKNARVKVIADGGDGIIDAFLSNNKNLKILKFKVSDAYGKKHFAPCVLLNKKTALIETAKICGLGGIAKKDLRVLDSTSYGVGEMIMQAAKKGVKNFYVGLGGVACNDGGAGMARAMGVNFFNSKGIKIPDTTKGLVSLHSFDTEDLKVKGLQFFALTDVVNPLLGPKGSAAVYGPQKSKKLSEVAVIEKALITYNNVLTKQFKKDISTIPGTGAAGAIAAGMLAFLNARFINGAEFIFNKFKIEDLIKKADLVITTEGKLDEQTFMGKAPFHAVRLAGKYNKPLAFICGKNEIKNYKNKSITAVFELCALCKNEEDSLKKAAKLLNKTAAVLFNSRPRPKH
ncbi:Glycerate kinase [Elusimicrobium minutum Pei191]|uniref:Glycerate kinase n=1 Tax=Elusimicrobium minutum (strain Pei191) TaxID=445932 RepID=B2KBF8_ELUMP|nr:glycerate kinase [Elusimicrobium minutum]ACC97980.1 Glycerate kinase [Elusimicrobium minutum Pei191]